MARDKEMFFFIADISGYTSYMLTNNTACEHAKLSISILIETLVMQVKLPMEISKLEGDAIFLYLSKAVKDKLSLSKKIFTFFQIFEEKARELQQSNICTCGACKNIEKLQLKVIAHYGSASFQKIGPFRELSGVDVIILHRLLKNHVPNHRYFLLTESAYQHMLIPETVKVSRMEESYDDVGKIPIYVCDPPPISEEDLPSYNTGWHKLRRWFGMKFHKVPESVYRNLPKLNAKKYYLRRRSKRR